MQRMPSRFSSSPLAAERVPWLRGTLQLPGDSILMSLALCCAAIARGETMIERPGEALAEREVAAALAAMGVRIEALEERWHVTGLGARGLLEPQDTLDLRGSTLGSALIMGLAGVYDFPTMVRPNEESGLRRTSELLALLEPFGVSVNGDPSHPPLLLKGATDPLPAAIALPDDNPAMKAALLFAALGVGGRSRFTGGGDGWDHAERMLRRFGATLEVFGEGNERRIEIDGLVSLRAQQLALPADPSLAALGCVAASIVPASEVEIPNVLVNPARTAILSALVAMGARIEVQNLRTLGDEEVADLSVRQEGLKGIALSAKHVGNIAHELPLLAVAAAFAEGETTFHLPRMLPMLDRARLAATAQYLELNGIEAEAEEEVFVVHGAAEVEGGGRLITDDDAGMALAFLVLGLGAKRQVTIADGSVIEERLPGFVARFENIGASFIHDAEWAGGAPK